MTAPILTYLLIDRGMREQEWLAPGWDYSDSLSPDDLAFTSLA